MQIVPLSSILLTPDQQESADKELVQRAVQLLYERFSFPPAQVCLEGESYRLLSGVESLMAARELGASSLPVIVEPRTQAQREEDVMSFLNDPCWQVESTGNIARYCYVRKQTVVDLRTQHSDPAARRQVQRGGQTYMQKPPRHSDSVPVYLYDERFFAPKMPPDVADVILSAIPLTSDAPVEECAARIVSVLNENGTLYLLSMPEHFDDLCTWRHKLEAAGLPFAALMVWTVKNCASGLPPFEHILVMGQLPPELLDHQVVTGPRAHNTRDSATLYRKPTWLSTRLLRAHQGKVLLDPFVQSSFALKGAQRAGMRSASGYLLTSAYRDEVTPFEILPC